MKIPGYTAEYSLVSSDVTYRAKKTNGLNNDFIIPSVMVPGPTTETPIPGGGYNDGAFCRCIRSKCIEWFCPIMRPCYCTKYQCTRYRCS